MLNHYPSVKIWKYEWPVIEQCLFFLIGEMTGASIFPEELKVRSISMKQYNRNEKLVALWMYQIKTPIVLHHLPLRCVGLMGTRVQQNWRPEILLSSLT